MTMKFMALALLTFAGAATVYAQGVAFTVTSLPRQMRQEGITETAGEVVLTAIQAGTIPANSTIDFVFSAPVTNNSTASTSNISLANNVSCATVNPAPPPAFLPICPAGLVSATLTGGNTVRLRFNADTPFLSGESINLSRIRVNANSAIGVGAVTVTMSGISSNPAVNPITFSDPQRQVGVLSPAITVNFNHNQATFNPVTFFRTCAVPNPPTPIGLPTIAFNPLASDNPNFVFVRVNEVFPGALTTLAQEITFSANLLPTNGSLLTINFTGVPAGWTLAFVGTPILSAVNPVDLVSTNRLTSSTIAVGAPTPSSTVDQTTAGAAQSFTFPITGSDLSQVERVTFAFALEPTSTSSTTPLSVAAVGSPANIQATVQLTPITTTDSTIVRFASNQIGPTTVATITDCTTRILMTWVATVADVETGVAINNTSSDDAAFGAGPTLGATSQNGTCTLTGYPSAGGTPVSFTTATINAGSSLAFLMSATTGFSNFTGYVLTVCNFEAAHAFTFITNGRGTVTGPTLAQGYVANIIQPGTRPTFSGASESLGN
jgi:hypothetical protein